MSRYLITVDPADGRNTMEYFVVKRANMDGAVCAAIEHFSPDSLILNRIGWYNESDREFRTISGKVVHITRANGLKSSVIDEARLLK